MSLLGGWLYRDVFVNRASLFNRNASSNQKADEKSENKEFKTGGQVLEPVIAILALGKTRPN